MSRTSQQVTPDGSSQGTSLSLIGRVKANDSAAWQRLVALYGPMVYSWAKRHNLSNEDAADVTQEVFTALSRSIGRYEPQPPSRFRAWLWTITRNKVRDLYRSSADQPAGRGGDQALRELAEFPEIWSDDASEATRADVRSLFHRALQLIQVEFQPQTWRAFWKSVVEDEPTDRIAAELGMSANGVRQAKSRVLRRLRAELGDQPME